MTIFVAVATLEDNELINTVNTAISQAANPDEVSVGVAFTTSRRFYRRTVKHFGPNVRHIWFSNRRKKNLGVGKGRSRALSLYAGEDYVLQVDAHTHFQPNWDVTLIKWLEDAEQLTGNPKTMLTTFPPKYLIGPVGERYQVAQVFFPYFTSGFLYQTRIPKWETVDLEDVPEHLKPSAEYLPSTKFQAAFVFARGQFAKESGVFKPAIFMDEELTQTITLMTLGWTFVAPNKVLPVSHFYMDDIVGDTGKRQALDEIKSFRKSATGENMTRSYLQFINDPANAKGVEMFFKFNRVHPIYGAAHRWRVPADFFRPEGEGNE